MNIRTALILLLEFILALGLIAAAIWAVEYFIGVALSAKARMIIAIACFILLALFLLGGGRPPMVTW